MSTAGIAAPNIKKMRVVIERLFLGLPNLQTIRVPTNVIVNGISMERSLTVFAVFIHVCVG